MSETKPFIISKQLVMKAYRLVKANAGGAGIDQQSLNDFDENLKDNLYKIWNRLSSGSYFPPSVKAVAIPKKTGGQRILGIPTVSDRIAQMVVKLIFEPMVEPIFLSDSYGYRPNKSAIEAIGITRKRCWFYDWVVEFDIKGLFDNINHELLMKAVEKHTDNKRVILYIKRWLKALVVMTDGSTQVRTKGTPQGGVISPILSNLFLHYVFDIWMQKQHPNLPWCRYADDGIIHCKTLSEAQNILSVLKDRFQTCMLEIHQDKTKIIYCQDATRKQSFSNTKFTFLGYDFRKREVKAKKAGNYFLSFTPAASSESQKAMRQKIREMKLHRQNELSLEEIARICNPILRGWLEYYGHYNASALYSVLRYFNMKLVRWAIKKYKNMMGSKTRASKAIRRVMKTKPDLFAHWKRGMSGSCT